MPAPVCIRTGCVAQWYMNDNTSAAKLNVAEHPKLANKVRFVTAASLFDGHDASINIMRRILQSNGVEVVHLGHNRSVDEVVTAALAEDVQGIAISSYQGGHVEYFKYMIDLLKQRGGAHIKVFGGGGGVIVPEEIADLHGDETMALRRFTQIGRRRCRTRDLPTRVRRMAAESLDDLY